MSESKTQVFVSDFTGATDAIKIQAALDFAFANKQKVVIAEERKYQLNATIKIREGVELRGERATHYSLDANLRGFELEQGASFCGGTISIGINNYAKEVVYLDGKYRYDSTSAKTVIRDLVMWNWTSTTSGIGLSLFSGGDTHQIQFLNIERLVIWNFDIGIKLKATEPTKGQTWINANRFDKITLSECNEMIVIESNTSVPFECSGNIFSNLQIQPGTSTKQILKISGMGNSFTGVLWDTQLIQHTGPIAEFTSTSSMNNINMMFFPEERYVNNGENSNRVGVGGLTSEGELVGRDWNTVQKMGTYRIIEPSGLTAALHQPVGAYEYGIMTVFTTGDNVAQFYVPHQGTENFYIRSKFGLTDWTPWKLSGNGGVPASIEVLSADPVNPKVGKMWIRSDL
ncbi:pyocin knob domain-containing protein [Viridibacillus arvi]|uniref:pyocin knob domain-containing protein n=1 Tax=Viridibacillus arvi TaxID=263475 RepID=UPI0006A97AAF|nr:pyocin knob domain-containing protein [Viridibacillus arvi]